MPINKKNPAKGEFWNYLFSKDPSTKLLLNKEEVDKARELVDLQEEAFAGQDFTEDMFD